MCHRQDHDLKAWQTQPVQEYFVWMSVWKMEKLAILQVRIQHVVPHSPCRGTSGSGI